MAPVQGGGPLNMSGPFTLSIAADDGETLTTTISSYTQQMLSVQFSDNASGSGGSSSANDSAAPNTTSSAIGKALSSASAAHNASASAAHNASATCTDIAPPSFTCTQQKVGLLPCLLACCGRPPCPTIAAPSRASTRQPWTPSPTSRAQDC